MSGRILDGRKVSEQIRNELKPRIQALLAEQRAPALAVVLAGNDPASEIYVRNKIAASRELGVRSLDFKLAADVSTADILELTHRLNADPDVDGILLQSPLPKHVDAKQVLLSIDPAKDADGFHPFNVGSLVAGRAAPKACTPAGIIQLLKRSAIPMAGQNAVVVGRSDIVGKPMALMFLHENATVTICHSRTRDLAGECRRADILVAATGKAGLITADHIREGVVVIDVGMNRVTDREEAHRLIGYDAKRWAAFEEKGTTLVGDVQPQAMQQRSAAYTPVPGGVGPLTIAMLMSNTVSLAEAHLR